MIELTSHPIDFTAVTESVRSHLAGAVVLFLGTVREFTRGEQTSWLEYQAYDEMARVSMVQLEVDARSRFAVTDIAIVHRTGHLGLGEISVAVAVSSPHRSDAFEAGRWLIDTLKEQVPIWKKEHYSDGREEWLHPQSGTPGFRQSSLPASVPQLLQLSGNSSGEMAASGSTASDTAPAACAHVTDPGKVSE